MVPNQPVEVPSQFNSTETQRFRSQSQSKFNRLYIYFPLLVAAIGVLVVTGLLLWLTFFSGLFTNQQSSESALELSSGVADAIFIIFTFPLLVISLIMPALFIAGYWYSRKNNFTPLKSIQNLTWQLDNKLTNLDEKVHTYSERTNSALVNFESKGSQFEKRLANIFKKGSQEERNE